MTAMGIALTVTTAIFLMALVAGLDRAFVSSGSPLNVLVLRKGSEAELSGGFDASLFPTLKTLPGIAKDSKGEPMVSGEWVVVIVLPRKDGTGEVNVTVRGMMPDGLEMRQLPNADKQPSVKLARGTLVPEWSAGSSGQQVRARPLLASQHRRHHAVWQRIVESRRRVRRWGIGLRIGSMGRRQPDGLRLRSAGRILVGISARDRSDRGRCLEKPSERRPAAQIGRHAGERLLREADKFRNADQSHWLGRWTHHGVSDRFSRP